MRTMPRHYSGSPGGDYRRMCDICGSVYYRKSLVRKADKLFYCPTCAPEIDRVTLSKMQEMNAARAGDFQPRTEEE